MNYQSVLAELYSEKDRLLRVIAVVEEAAGVTTAKKRGRPKKVSDVIADNMEPVSSIVDAVAKKRGKATAKKAGRRAFSPKQRKEQAEKMRLWWAAKKRAAKKTANAAAAKKAAKKTEKAAA